MTAIRNQLLDFLPFKKGVLANPNKTTGAPVPLVASVTTEGRAGIRKIRIRDHEIISDSGYKTGGSDFGPVPAELAVAALAGCLSHGWVGQAALRDVQLRALRIDVETAPAPEGSKAPASLRYTVIVDSDASAETLEEIRAHVDEHSYVRRLLGAPVQIGGSVTQTGGAA
mgnify:CR=1 FL=1